MSKLAWCEIITGSMSVMWWARLQTALPTCHETQCHRETRHADSVIKLSPTLSHRSLPSRGIDAITDSGIMTQLSFDASSHDGWSEATVRPSNGPAQTSTHIGTDTPTCSNLFLKILEQKDLDTWLINEWKNEFPTFPEKIFRQHRTEARMPRKNNSNVA